VPYTDKFKDREWHREKMRMVRDSKERRKTKRDMVEVMYQKLLKEKNEK